MEMAEFEIEAEIALDLGKIELAALEAMHQDSDGTLNFNGPSRFLFPGDRKHGLFGLQPSIILIPLQLLPNLFLVMLKNDIRNWLFR